MKKVRGKVSIKDIAKEAGVSISSVSYAINNKKNVSEETRKKILEIVDRLNYRTNNIARSLRTKTTMTVAVIVPDIATPFTSQIVKSMEEVARSRGYTLILGCSFYDLKEEEKQVNVFLDQYVDGIIFFNGYDNQAFVKKIFDRKVSVVLVDRENEDERIPSVNVDNIKGIEMAVDLLVSYGHKKIGYVTFSFKDQTVVKRRYEGYCRGLKKNNLSFVDDFVINEDKFRLNEIDGTYEYMKEYFKSNTIPTSFISFTDYNAYGIIMAARDTGIKIPEQLSVIGYDNIIFSHVITPPLTTVRQPKKLMGETGMNLMLNLIEGKRLKDKKIILEPNLIERQSVSSPQR